MLTDTVTKAKEFNSLLSERHMEQQSRDLFVLPVGEQAIPLKSDRQQFVLYNLCHQAQRPRSLMPGVRILGLFPSQEAAQQHADKHFVTNRSPNTLFLGPTHQVFPICESTENQLNPEYTRKTIDLQIKLHNDHAELLNREHQENVASQKAGKSGGSILARRKPREIPLDTPSTSSLPQQTETLTEADVVLGQRFAVITTLFDIRPEVLADGKRASEPLFAVLFASGTEQEAVRYAKYTANAAYPDATLDVVSMYEWLFPEHVNTQLIPEEFANKNLQSLSDARKSAGKEIEAVERYMAEKNQPIPTIDIGGTGTSDV